MPDTAEDVLAPNAPPQGIPDSNVPPSLMPSGTPPIAGNQPPIATESGDPLSSMIQPQTTPAYQDPEMVAGSHHQSWLAHVMDKVGGILGGDTTLHVTKDKDGNVTVTHDPSTEGEKWGRVAAAALGGAAHGIAVGQGPGGPARAAAAGIETGLQQPQQRLDEANKEASVEQQRMTQAANNALIHQKTYQEMLTSQQLKTNIDAQSSALMNEYRDGLASSEDSKDFGVVSGVEDLMKVFNANPDFFKSHTDLTLKTALVPKPGGGTEIHAIATDPGDDDRPIGKGGKLMQIAVDPTTQKPTLTTTNASSTEKAGKVRMANQAMIAQYIGLMNTWSKDHPSKEPKTLPEMNVAIANEHDPQEKAALMAARDETFKQDKELRIAGRNVNPPGVAPAGAMIDDLIKPGAAFAPGTVNGTDAQKLASGDVVLNDLPKRMGKGVPTPQEMIGAAEAYSQAQYGLGYSATQIDQEKKFYENMKTQGATLGIDKMIGVQGKPGYLDTVLDLAKQAGITDTAAPINKVTQHIKQVMGQTAANNFQTALGEVQRSLPSLIGNPLLGGSDSDMKLKAAQEMLGKNPTLGSLTGQAETIRQMLKGSMDSITRNNRFFQRQYGLQGPYAHQFSPTHSATAPNQPAATQQPPQLPAPQPTGEIRQNAQGQYKQLQGSNWVDVAPPTR